MFLYSDEDMGWLTETGFRAKWMALLPQALRRGHRITIIHTVNRGFDEMLSAIEKWLPIYMTGAVEPYYCPRPRDGILLRTLFIAPKPERSFRPRWGTSIPA
jgi:hypothetical protein